MCVCICVYACVRACVRACVCTCVITRWLDLTGPSHFLACGSPSGATLLKHRHLRQLGYALVVVPYWEWQLVRGDETSKVEYLRGKLDLSRVEEPAAAAHSHAAEVNEPCAAPASWTSRQEARDDIEPRVEEREEKRASGDVDKTCSVCRESKPESCFSRKQLAARAHSRKGSQCTGMSSGSVCMPAQTSQVTAVRAPDHACKAGEGSCGSAGTRCGLVCALLVAAVAALQASILFDPAWE